MSNNNLYLDPRQMVEHYEERMKIGADVYCLLSGKESSSMILDRALLTVWKYKALADLWKNVVKRNQMYGDYL